MLFIAKVSLRPNFTLDFEQFPLTLPNSTMPAQFSSRRTIILSFSVLLIAEVHKTPKSPQSGIPNCAFHSESMISFSSPPTPYSQLNSQRNPTQSSQFQFNLLQFPSTKLNLHEQRIFRPSIASKPLNSATTKLFPVAEFELTINRHYRQHNFQ